MIRTRFAAALAAVSLLGASALWSTSAQAQCVSLTTLGSASTQNFDTLANTGTSSTLPTGWFFAESGANANATYTAGTGSGTAGDTYSFGAAASTDRALGGLQSGSLIPTIGACFTNNSGNTITSLDVAYTGEQWRLGTVARVDQLDFQYSLDAASLTTGTWTDVNALDFLAPNQVAPTGAKDGNAAGNRTALSNSIASLTIANGATVWIRWNDLNATSSDDGLSVDDFSLTPQGAGPVIPALSINNVSVTEGNAGTINAQFSVTLSVPAGAGGVSFDIATADGTATVVGNDYVLNSLNGQTIASGSSGPFLFNVTVNGDATVEPNETFFVNVTNVVGANVADGQGQGTISNDDFVITPIHDIQGPGSSSPIVGSAVTTTGIVYALKSNGFFMQEPDASVDADPLTSEGIFVFTSAAPPASAAVGNLVRVAATVVEFVPASDPLQPPLTELSFATVTQLSAGNPLPTATPLTASFPSPAGAFDQLERLEGMRVSVASLTVNAPTDGNVSEANATSTTNGVFFGVVSGSVARSLREPGIQPPDPAPAGTIPPIPRWDGNPEILRVDSDNLPGTTALNVGFGQTVNGLIGPLDYGFRRYMILPEPGVAPTVAGSVVSAPVSVPTAGNVTIASYNLERFFDTVNDPGITEPVLTPAAFNNRLAKASLGIRNALRTPDVVGVVEVENLNALQALATAINNDAVAAAQPNPMYAAYLVEGNDLGGIDVGFLVKTAPVVGVTPRVTVNAVVQELDGSLFTNPDSSTDILNDRPPLRLDAVVNNATGQSYPLTVIVNHLRSFLDSTDPTPGSNGWPTNGDRVRAKRQAQAVDLANFVQARQTANANEQIVLVGDFNAFEFNDGLGDSMGTIAGLPSPDNTTAVTGDGADLVNPDFDNLFDTVAALQRYSYTFDGVAQSIDHALVSASVALATTAPRIEHAYINADFPEVERNNAASPNRLSDHDPLVVFLAPNVFVPIDVSITKTASTPTPIAGGSNFSYTVTVTNAGPQPAANVAWNDVLPTSVRFVSMANVAGWTCTTPAAGSTGTINCSNPSQAVGSAVFTVVANIAASTAAGAISNTATVTTTSIDSNPANNSATANQTITVDANLSILLTDSPDPVSAGSPLTYVATLTNGGPSDAQGVSIALPLPATLTFVSAVASAGGVCVTPAVGANGTVTCTWAGVTLPAGQRSVTVIAGVPAATASGSILNAIATAASSSPDSVPANNTSTTATAVNVAADLSITLTDTPDPVTAGTNLTYLATLTNGGPSDAQDATISLPLAAGTSFVSATPSAGGSCNAASPVVCSWAGATIPGGTRSVSIVVAVAAAQTGSLSATATASSPTADPSAGNNTATAMTVVQVQADLAISLNDAPDPVVAGTQLTYTAVVSNAGPSDATAVVVTLPTPANTSFVSGSVTGGGSCAGSPVVCTVSGSIAPGASRTVSIVMLVAASAPEASVISATATVTAGSPDPNAANNTASTTTNVITQADLVLTLTAATTQVAINVPVNFTATSLNQGPSDAQDVSITITLTPDFRYAGHTAAGATCTTPQVGNTGAITCTWAGATAPGVTRTLVVSAFSNTEGQTAVNASTTSNTTDPVANNNLGGVTVQVGYLVEEIPTLSSLGLILMGLLFGLIGFVAVRREM